jgi:hypothetical protein
MSVKRKIAVFLIASAMTAGIILSVVLIAKVTPLPIRGFDLEALSTQYGTITMDCKYDDKKHTLTVKQEVDYLNKSKYTLTEIKFHIYANAYKEAATAAPVAKNEQAEAYPNGLSYGGITISSVQNNGYARTIKTGGTDNTLLTVGLAQNLNPNGRTVITIDYVVTLANIKHRLGYANGFVNLGNFYPVPAVYEKGVWQTHSYSSNGDPFYNDLYNFNVTLDTDAKFIAAASGEEIAPRKYRAYAIRDFAMVLSKDFKILSKNVGDTKVNYYFANDDTAEISVQTAANALAYFSNEFYDYPYSTLSVVQTEFLHGGMEYGTLIYISLDVTDTIQYQTVIVHEIAHQWWYGIIGNNQTKTAWLDEGLAEYSTAVFFETHPVYGQSLDSAAESNFETLAMYEKILAEFNVVFDKRMSRDINNFNSGYEYTFNTYCRGMILFYNLAKMAGYRTFNRALAAFAAENRFDFGTEEKLVACVEKTLNTQVADYFNNYLAGR